MMQVDGRCHCGYVRYTAIVDPASVAVCHCSDCQMLSGTAFRTGVSTIEGSLALQSGEPRLYVKTADSGARRVHAFCAECGTPVYSTAADVPAEAPARHTLRVGCLSQRAQLQRSLHRQQRAAGREADSLNPLYWLSSRKT